MAKKCFITTPNFTQADMLILGDSVYAGQGGNFPVADLVFNSIDLARGYKINSLAVSGENSSQQMARFNADANKTRYNIVVIGTGLNDVDNLGKTAIQSLADVQALVNAVRAGGNPNVKIILMAMTPAKQRWIDLKGTTNGAIAQQKWVDMNIGYMGGANAVTGMDLRVDEHSLILNDGTGNLKSEYDNGDGIHPNNSGIAIIAGVAKQSAKDLNMYAD